jgi:hypothetical protein
LKIKKELGENFKLFSSKIKIVVSGKNVFLFQSSKIVNRVYTRFIYTYGVKKERKNGV